MSPDRAAIDAVTTALRQASAKAPLDLEQTAAVAVTTLQGLGWRPVRRAVIRMPDSHGHYRPVGTSDSLIWSDVIDSADEP